MPAYLTNRLNRAAWQVASGGTTAELSGHPGQYVQHSLRPAPKELRSHAALPPGRAADNPLPHTSGRESTGRLRTPVLPPPPSRGGRHLSPYSVRGFRLISA